MAHGREEGALSLVGLLGDLAGLDRFGLGLEGLLEEPGIVHGHAHVGSNGRQQALVVVVEAIFLLGALYAEHTDDLASRRYRNTQIGGGFLALSLDTEFLIAPAEVFIDQHRFARPDDLGSQPFTISDRLDVVAEGIEEVDHVALFVEHREVNDIGLEEIAHLVSHHLDQHIRIELRGQCSADVVDRSQLGGPLLAFPEQAGGFIEEPGVFERHAHAVGEGREQAQIAFGKRPLVVHILQAEVAPDHIAHHHGHEDGRLGHFAFQHFFVRIS